MKYECSIIEDLLPLYKDGVCSAESSKAVEEHLAECPKCSEVMNKLQDTVIDDMIMKEKEDVIGSQSKYFKRKSALIGTIIAAVFALPILICLIVDLVTGNGLGWFFIVLAAMLIPTSLIVVPLMAPKNRMFLTMTSFTGSVILLLAVCCIYSGGRWFFVAASATLFGLTVCFMPFIACRRPVKEYLQNAKGLTVMGSYTLTFFLMMLCIGLFVRTPGFFPMAFAVSVPLVLMAWIIFLIIRYLPFHGLVKTGICIAALSLFSYFSGTLFTYLAIKASNDTAVVVRSDPSLVTLFVGLGIGMIFAAIGLFVGKKGGEKK